MKMGHPGASDAALIESSVRAMVGRTVSAWAVDYLRLRARGLDRPSFRAARVGPFGALTPAPDRAKAAAADRAAAMFIDREPRWVERRLAA